MTEKIDLKIKNMKNKRDNKIVNIRYEIWEQLKHLTIYKSKGSVSDLLEEILKENNLWDQYLLEEEIGLSNTEIEVYPDTYKKLQVLSKKLNKPMDQILREEIEKNYEKSINEKIN